MSWKGGERSGRKDSLVGDEMVKRKWFKFELREQASGTLSHATH